MSSPNVEVSFSSKIISFNTFKNLWGYRYMFFIPGFKFCFTWWWWWIVFAEWLTDKRRFSLISSRDHCQRSSPSWISDTPRAGFEPAQNLSSGLVEWSCAVVKRCKVRKTFDQNCLEFSEIPVSWIKKEIVLEKSTTKQISISLFDLN